MRCSTQPRQPSPRRGLIVLGGVHGGLQATFSTELVRRRKLYPLVHNLIEAMELRHTADYSDIQIPPRRATRIVRAAAEFLHHVKEVIDNA